MKAVTANRLADGRVVYLAADGSWAERFAGATVLEPDAAEAALTKAKARVTEIADAYLIEAEAGGAPAGREAFRETLRNAGPTVRRDLGKQAGNL
ncbi:MAG: DUF2849 domain-containing protein [Parvularculaceae bacterium]